MNHTVTNGRNLRHILNHTVIGVGKGSHDQSNGYLVIRACAYFPIGLATRYLMNDVRAANGNSLNHPLGDHLFLLPIK